MKKKSLSIILVIISALLCCFILVSCRNVSGDGNETSSDTLKVSDSESESDSRDAESESEKTSDVRTETETSEREYDETLELDYNGNTADIIELGSTLSNKVQSYYQDGSKDVFVMENASTVINYNMNGATGAGVASITDKNGNAYIANTMDVFVQMKDGNKYYSSDSFISPSMNIYRLGYYYYENRIEGQLFVGAGSSVEGRKIKHYDMSKLVNVEDLHLVLPKLQPAHG